MRTGCGSFANKNGLGDEVPLTIGSLATKFLSSFWDENGIDKALCLELRNPALKTTL